MPKLAGIPLVPPGGERKILLHVCCAPCCGSILEKMLSVGLDVTMLFYNPNIHPPAEYLRRKEEVARFATRCGVAFVDGDDDRALWFSRVEGLEHEPERGTRCTVCFAMRLERTARYAHEYGFPVMATSLGISRWKNLAQVNACGAQAASCYPGLSYWDVNWRKGGGSARGGEISRREGFYRQNYCGCVYSRRDADSRSTARPPRQNIAATCLDKQGPGGL